MNLTTVLRMGAAPVAAQSLVQHALVRSCGYFTRVDMLNSYHDYGCQAWRWLHEWQFRRCRFDAYPVVYPSWRFSDGSILYRPSWWSRRLRAVRRCDQADQVLRSRVWRRRIMRALWLQ